MSRECRSCKCLSRGKISLSQVNLSGNPIAGPRVRSHDKNRAAHADLNRVTSRRDIVSRCIFMIISDRGTRERAGLDSARAGREDANELWAIMSICCRVDELRASMNIHDANDEEIYAARRNRAIPNAAAISDNNVIKFYRNILCRPLPPPPPRHEIFLRTE